MKKQILTLATLGIASLVAFSTTSLYSDETVGEKLDKGIEKAQDKYQDAKDKAKDTYKDAKDGTNEKIKEGKEKLRKKLK